MTKQTLQTRDRVDALEKEVKNLSAIVLEMRKELGYHGVAISEHQAFFEMLQQRAIRKQQEKKIDIVKN